MKTRWMCWPALLGALAATSAAQARAGDDPTRGANTVLVMNLRPVGVPAGQAISLTHFVAAGVAARSELRVVTVEDVNIMVEHQKGLAKLACESDACITEMSKVANAELALSGTIGKVGAELVLSLSLIDTTNTQPTGKGSRSAPTIEELQAAMPGLVAEVFGWGEETTVSARGRFSLPEGKTVSFAVFDLQAEGVSRESAMNLTQVLAAEIKSVRGTEVTSRDDVAALLQLQAEKTKMSCEEEMACLAEIGGALGVEKLVVGHAGLLGGSYLVTLRLIDVEAVAVDNRVTESFDGLESQLIGAVRHAGRRLLGLEPVTSGTLALTGTQFDAVVSLDNEKIGTLPMHPIERLLPGRHTVRIMKDGFEEWRTDFYVGPDSVTSLFATLEGIPPEWYERWWVWTIVGVTAAVAVGIAVGVYIDNATKLPSSTLGTFNR